MAKRKKIEDLGQLHGKAEEFEVTTLDQIWGDTGLSRYSTLNEEVYKNYLSELNKTDLQTHASQVGIIPIDNIEMLNKRLVKEFLKYVSAYKKPTQTKQSEQIALSKEAKRILEEGR